MPQLPSVNPATAALHVHPQAPLRHRQNQHPDRPREGIPNRSPSPTKALAIDERLAALAPDNTDFQ